MKKVVALTLAAVAVVGLVGCGNTSTSTSTTPSTSTSTVVPTTTTTVPTSTVTSTPTTTTPTTTTPVLPSYDKIPQMDIPGYNDPLVKVATGKNGVATSQSMEASKVAIEVLNAGGNAFDAAIAAAFAIGTTNPWLSGLGGGGYMVAYNAATGKPVVYDYREIAPAGATDSRFTASAKYDAKGAGVPGWLDGMFTAFEQNKSGNLTIAEVIEPARRLAAEGIEVFADHESNLASGYEYAKTTVGNEEATEMFINKETLQTPKKGEKWANPVLARTLAKIQAEGRDAFYSGELAQAMVDASLAYGGVFTLADVQYAKYATKVRPAIEGTYKDKYKVVSMAPSSSGGLVIVEAMNMMEGLNYKLYQAGYDVKGADNAAKAKALGISETDYNAKGEVFIKALNNAPASVIVDRDDPNFVNAMAVALQLSFGDRYQYIADMDQVFVPIAGLTNKDYAQHYFNMHYRIARLNGENIETVAMSDLASAKADDTVWKADIDAESTFGTTNDSDPTTGRRRYWKQFGNPCAYMTGADACPSGFVKAELGAPAAATGYGGGTTHLSVADKDGNMVSMTQTVNFFWGSGIFPKGGGFPLNNEMNDFAGKESGQSELAYSQLAGAVKPFKRPLSSMSPTVVLEKAGTDKWKALITIGASGSTNIPVANFNNIINILDYGMNAVQASEYERIGNHVTASPNTGFRMVSGSVVDAIPATISHADYVKLVETPRYEGTVSVASYYNQTPNAEGKHELIDPKFEAVATPKLMNSSTYNKVKATVKDAVSGQGTGLYRFVNINNYEEVKELRIEGKTKTVAGKEIRKELSGNKRKFGLIKGTSTVEKSTADWMTELGYYTNSTYGGIGTLQSALYHYNADGKLDHIEAIAHYANETNKALAF